MIKLISIGTQIIVILVTIKLIISFVLRICS